MTNLLAIDTATDACSLALWLDGEITQRHSLSPREHVRIALPMLQELLLETEISLPELDALVLGAGPGSFTGLRIAAGLVQGLAFGLNIPVVLISTLRTIAQGLYREEGIEKAWVNMDAGMGQIYAGEYKVDAQGLMQVVTEDGLYNLESSKEHRGIPSPLAGKGGRRPDGGCLIVSKTYPQAQYSVELGYHEFMAGNLVTAEQAQPIYLRSWSGS